jgi:hypothetical protein
MAYQTNVQGSVTASALSRFRLPSLNMSHASIPMNMLIPSARGNFVDRADTDLNLVVPEKFHAKSSTRKAPAWHEQGESGRYKSMPHLSVELIDEAQIIASRK